MSNLSDLSQEEIIRFITRSLEDGGRIRLQKSVDFPEGRYEIRAAKLPQYEMNYRDDYGCAMKIGKWSLVILQDFLEGSETMLQQISADNGTIIIWDFEEERIDFKFSDLIQTNS